jgi:hypothetical protein
LVGDAARVFYLAGACLVWCKTVRDWQSKRELRQEDIKRLRQCGMPAYCQRLGWRSGHEEITP